MAYTRPNGADRFKDLSANREGLPSYELDNEFNLLSQYVNGVGIIVAPNDQYNEETNTPIYVSPNTFDILGDHTETYHYGRKFKADLSGSLVYSTIEGSTESGGTTTVTIRDNVLDTNLSTVYFGTLSADGTSGMPLNLIPDDAVNYIHKDGSVPLDNEAPIEGYNLGETLTYNVAKVGSDNKTYFGDNSTPMVLLSSVAPKWNDGVNSVELVMTGEIRMWPTNTAPAGWLLCKGQAVSRTTYADLFGLIDITFGAGDGSTTFNLPDFRGRSPVGTGLGDADYATTWDLAEKGGAEKHVLTETEIPPHAHYYDKPNWLGTGDNTGGEGHYEGTTATYTQNTGGGAAHNNVHPVLGISFIIKT